MKKEMISINVKLMFLWMRWISQLHKHNHLETNMIPHFKGRKKILMQVNKFLLHLLMLPRYWRKTYEPLDLK
ncbi:hypothetical protein Goshw_014182 [Gossypium schwendimanii]|uniref:Uncharacterized protein n=1 Tax=Gossypium schwendimanii TaxID=34291 RepID=A0A7J9LWN4_GOSSC|nr:hypothetical protein [Gossypium schwendimanii]